MRARHLYMIVCVLIQIGILNAQNNKSIQIRDSRSNLPLIGATVKCDDYGTVSDVDGRVTIDQAKCQKFTVSYIGYESKAVSVSDTDVIYLDASSTILESVTVTGSRYQRRLSETTVSVDVLQPQLINAINTSKADEVMNKLPGVQVVGGQANIRGGSGFSYGAGSRVMVLIDDLPALQTDAGFANWGDMPIEHMDQIEVLKGAASALYGSSALNGIINFRRKKPTSTPQFSAFTAYTTYGDPKNLKNKWWSSTPYRANAGLSYSQKINKLDLGIHGFSSRLESFNDATFDKKIRLGTNLLYHLSDQLQVGLNVMFNHNDGSDFFLWGDAIRSIYRPFPNTISSGVRTRTMIDPLIKYRDSHNGEHKLQGRIYLTDNQLNNNQANKSTSNIGEYQYQRNVSSLGLLTTSGVYFNRTTSDSQIVGDSSFVYQNLAFYTQLEKRFVDKLTTSLGLRYEYNDQQGPKEFMGFQIPNGRVSDGALVARAGISYEVSQYTNVRASWGQGYRYPTIAERYISTSFGSFTISPNPLLKPEYGFSTELAVKQGLKIGGIKGFLDVAAFWQEYSDMIEFTFVTNPFGFRPINVGNTRITGGEISFIGQFDIADISFTTLTGYTYINPTYKDFTQNEEIQASVSSGANVLKYRSKHSFKTDIEGKWRWVSLGMSYQRYSHQDNIDKALEEPLPGVDQFEIKAFRTLNPNGYGLLDFRAGLTYHKFKLSAILSNFNNSLYTIRPGLAEAPKNYTLRLDYKF